MTAESASPPVISFKECRDEEIAGFFANEGKTFHPLLLSCREAAQSRVVGAPHFQLKNSRKDKLRNERKASARFVSAGTAPSIQICRSTLADSPDGENICPAALSKSIQPNSMQPRPVHSRPALASGTLDLGTLFAGSGSSRQRSRAAKVVCDPLEDKPVMRLSPAQKAAVQKTLQLHTAVNSETKSLSNLLPEKLLPENDVQKSVQNLLLERLEIADEQLHTLICSWSKLPDRFKETIRALVEVSAEKSAAQSSVEN